MKLNFGKWFVLLLGWIFSLISCAMTLFLCVWPDTIARGFEALYGLMGKNKADIVGAAFLALYVIVAVLSALVLFCGMRRRGDRGFITVDSSDVGKTRIAVGAVEQMIRQAVRGVEGITEMKSGIVNNEDAISINVSVAIANGAHVPSVTMNIQRTIRSYIELNCGVAVREVCVSVHSLAGAEEGGRRGRRDVYVPSKPVAAPAVEPETPAFIPEVSPAQAPVEAPAEDDDAPVEEVPDFMAHEPELSFGGADASEQAGEPDGEARE